MRREGAPPAAGPAMPAHVDVLAGEMIDDLYESIPIHLGVDIRVKGWAIGCHVMSFYQFIRS
jgi:hypothetical protein